MHVRLLMRIGRKQRLRDLKQLQIHFQDYLLHQCLTVQNEVISTSKMSALKRLDIYRDGYYLRLVEALQQDYPVLHRILGDEDFDQLGRSYINVYPSPFRSVRWFGNGLSNFMQDADPYSDNPWLIEMAGFEWLLTESFDAQDSHVITLADMANIPFENWPGLRFSLHPSLRRLSLRWNIVPIWNEMKEQESFIEPVQTDAFSSWIIWRKAYEVQFCSLQNEEAYMVDAMASGQTFSAICEGLCEWVDEQEVAVYAATLLKRFIMDELITEVSSV
jgi:hypothetical protein